MLHDAAYGRWKVAWPILLLVAAVTAPAQEAAEPPAPPPGVEVSARLLTGLWRPAGRWGTAIFDLRNEGRAEIAAECAVQPERGAGANAAVTSVTLPPRSRKRVFVYYWGGLAQELRLEVRFPGHPGTGFAATVAGNSVSPAAFVGVLTDGAWVGPSGVDPDIVRVRLSPVDMPERLEGLDPFNCIHWIDPSPGALSLDARSTLMRWVRLGGHLLIETNEAARLEGLLPTPLPEISGTAILAKRLWFDSAPDHAIRELPALRLDTVGMEILAWTEHGPVAKSQTADLGRITVVGVRLPPTLPDAGILYRRLLRLPAEPEGRDFRSRSTEDALYQKLSSFKVTGLPGITTLVAWVLAYIIVVGPLEWWGLRRLRRPAWTWWIYPLSIAAFSAVLWWKSGAADIRPVRARCLQVLDAASDGSLVRVEIHAAALYPDPTIAVARIADPEAELEAVQIEGYRQTREDETPTGITDQDARVEVSLGEGEPLYLAGRWTMEGPMIELHVRVENDKWHVRGVNRSALDWDIGVLSDGMSVIKMPAVRAGAPFDFTQFKNRFEAEWNGRYARLTREWAGERAMGFVDDMLVGTEAFKTLVFVAPCSAQPCPLSVSGIAAWEERFDYVRCRVEMEGK